MTMEEPQGNQTLQDQILKIIGKENLPKSSVSNLERCIEILEEQAEDKGMDYIKENKDLIIDQIKKTDSMF